MDADLNEKKNMEIGIDKQETKEFLEKNNNLNNINFSHISTKESTTISSETEESFLSNKNNKINMIKEALKSDKVNGGDDIYYILKEKDKKRKKGNKDKSKNECYKSEYLSEKKNINIKAPKIPINYNQNFYIDKNYNQKNIGQKEYLKDTLIEKYPKNNDYKEISIFSHDKLLHLITNENLLNITNKKGKYNKLSITERFKHKFLTTVYFFPKK